VEYVIINTDVIIEIKNGRNDGNFWQPYHVTGIQCILAVVWVCSKSEVESREVSTGGFYQ